MSKRARAVFAFAGLFCALALGASRCGDDNDNDANGSMVTCGVDFSVTLGDASCELSVAQVKCVTVEDQDNEVMYQVVECEGKSSSCGVGFYLAMYKGVLVEGEVEIEDEVNEIEREGYFLTGDLTFSKINTVLSLAFSGTSLDDGASAISICVDNMSWSKDDDHYNNDDARCKSTGESGRFNCAEITDEDLCTHYLTERCDDEDISEEDCCSWDEEAGNCGAAAEDLPCELIDDAAMCNEISAECSWVKDNKKK